MPRVSPGGDVFGLWETNGTASGTVEIGGDENKGIKGAFSGGLLQDPPDFTRFDGEVLFRGWNTQGDATLWITNGTAAGTKELAPIKGAAINGLDVQPESIAVLGSKAIFAGADQEDTDGSLWVTNGTAKGTTEIGGEGNKGIAHVPFTDPDHDLPDGLQPSDLTTFGSKVLFAGEDNTLRPGTGTFEHIVHTLANQRHRRGNDRDRRFRQCSDYGGSGRHQWRHLRWGDKSRLHGLRR